MSWVKEQKKKNKNKKKKQKKKEEDDEEKKEEKKNNKRRRQLVVQVVRFFFKKKNVSNKIWGITVEMYKKAYNAIVYHMPGEDQWIKTNCDHVNPPMIRIQPGRPRRLRTRGREEPRNQYRMRKGGVSMRCSRCRGIGHNIRTCPQIRREPMNYRGDGRSAS
jgi:hypothetical protein